MFMEAFPMIQTVQKIVKIGYRLLMFLYFILRETKSGTPEAFKALNSKPKVHLPTWGRGKVKESPASIGFIL